MQLCTILRDMRNKTSRRGCDEPPHKQEAINLRQELSLVVSSAHTRRLVDPPTEKPCTLPTR